jgi:hypothetical protein
VAITITDLQPPVTATSWTIELGHRTFLFAGVPDPRPLWSTEIFPLVGPSLTIDAFVEYDEPVPNGRIEQRSIVIEVDGDAQSAMELAFRGDDGNLFVLVGVSVIDGSGAAYAAAAVFDVHGEEVEFSEGYSDYVADCQAKGSAWFATKLKSLPPQVRGQDLPPWAPVWDPDVAEAILLHRALRSDTVTAAAALESARERGLEGIIDRVRELPMNMRW